MSEARPGDEEEEMGSKLAPTVIIPWLFSLATIGVGIWQFADQSAQANREPFLKRQLDLCFEASEAGAKLATETDPAEWEKARKSFWLLYWGPLNMVEDRAVATAMHALGERVPHDAAPPGALPMRQLEGASRDLARAARDLILRSWRVDLPPLD
jgi:hypothetical protein